nr:uncharacterized protein LOC129262491 [Lytechinus pictus]
MENTRTSIFWCTICFTLWPRFIQAQREGDVRLMNGGQSSRGRVEVYDGERWTTVCDDYWDNVDAMVVCRQLGYDPGGAIAQYSAVYGMGTGYISLDNVQCFGQEEKLVHCPSSSRPSNCKHSEDAGVDCVPKDGDVRLVGGSSRNEGRVEIFHDRQWGTICDSRWDEDDASVVCRQVGFPSDHVTAVSNAYFGRGRQRVVLGNVGCSGSESSLLSCSSEWYPSSCFHSDDAGVICGESQSTSSSSTSSVLVGCLSFASIVLLILMVAIVIHFKRGKKLACPSGMRHMAENIRNPFAFQGESRNASQAHQEESELTPHHLPPEYPLTVHLDHHRPSYVDGPPINVTNISVNVNSDNRQIFLFPSDLTSPPPYSPSTTDARSSVSSGLMISPPPYSPSSEQQPPIAEENIDQRNTQGGILILNGSPEQSGLTIQPVQSPVCGTFPPPYDDHLSNHSITSTDDHNSDHTPSSPQHRASIISSNGQLSPAAIEQPPPYSPWSVSTFV